MDDQTELILELYKTQVQRWNKRREDEWRVTLVFWSGAAFFTAFLAGKFQTTALHLLVYSGLWLCYIFLWLRGVWWANARDKKWAKVYKSKLEVVLGDREKEKTYTDPTWYEFFHDWSVWAQALLTLLVFLVSWFVLYQTGECP